MGTHHGALALSANETSDWVQAHEALSRLSRERAALDAGEGRWLLCAWRSAAHLHLGYGSFVQYVESLFGYKRARLRKSCASRRRSRRCPASRRRSNPAP